jgi:WhiB family transcriptional regulator, redox-sensing transcriptional regulator
MTRRDGGWRSAAKATASTVPGWWAERALCAQADPNPGSPDRNQCELSQLAKRICARCAVRAECLEYALSGADTWGGITTGIWGATTPRERDQLRRQRKAEAA